MGDTEGFAVVTALCCKKLASSLLALCCDVAWCNTEYAARSIRSHDLWHEEAIPDVQRCNLR